MNSIDLTLQNDRVPHITVRTRFLWFHLAQGLDYSEHRAFRGINFQSTPFDGIGNVYPIYLEAPQTLISYMTLYAVLHCTLAELAFKNFCGKKVHV